MSAPGRLAAALSRSYRIERELGQGGMATVFLAEDCVRIAGSRTRSSSRGNLLLRLGLR